ncbi:unnamed protein product [Symbiodinium sp. CCMP2592]|nr:unnamed protein product [Symbiodinium sp. CCMP2592]
MCGSEDMWSLGVLVYVILVGQFPIGQSKQTKSELTRQIIKVETEPVRLMNLAGKLKRSIAAEQGRLEMRRRLQGQSSNTGSSSDFHKIAPSSEEPLTNPLTGSQQAQDETLARHLAVQVKRLKVVEFMRTLLRRNPEVRCSASEALQAEIFIQQQSQEVLDDDEGDLLVVNRRPLKRQKDGEKEGDKEADKEGDKVAADLQQNASEGSPVNQQRKSDKTSRDLSYQPDSPRHSKQDAVASNSKKDKEELEPEHQDEENSSSLPGGDPKVRIPPQRKRSVTALGNEESGGPGRLLQVPSMKKLNKAKTTGQLDSNANGSAEADANGIGSPRTSGLQLESPRALTPTPIPALPAPSRAGGGGSPTPMSPSNNGQPYPGDSDLLSGEPRCEASMSRVNSRMSSVGAKSIKSSMGVSMFSRDQSGFDLLHQLAGKSDAVASSFQFQDSGILDSSSPTRPRPASQRLNHMGSGHSVRSGNSFRSGASEMVLGPVGEGERSPEHSEAALPSPAQPRPLPPPPELPVNVEPRIPEEEGPTPSKLQRRVSASCLADADRPKPMLKRRVSFDEVLYMQHMVPVVPNQIPSPSPGSNASNGSNSSEEAGAGCRRPEKFGIRGTGTRLQAPRFGLRSPRSKGNWNLGKNMMCATCNHPKPTINTMGERAHDFYPLASQKMYCNGQKNCPECHAIVHMSHSECLACRDRKKNAATIQAHQACVVTTATGSKDAMRSDSLYALKAPDEVLALEGPRTAVDELVDKYRGMDALAIIDDLEKVKAGKEAIDSMEEQRRIAEEEAKEKERERERERKRKEAEEQAKKDLVTAQRQAAAIEAERKRKREAAQDLIASMLDAETTAGATDGDDAAAAGAAAGGQSGPGEGADARLERKAKLLKQAEELRQKQEQMKQKQAEAEAERRQRMRERRAARQARPAAGEAGAAEAVVLD